MSVSAEREFGPHGGMLAERGCHCLAVHSATLIGDSLCAT